MARIREAAVLPSAANVSSPSSPSARIAAGVMVTNALATGVWTVGAFAALCAGYLAPELRTTASNLSGVVNGLATILLFAVVDPYLAVLTDDVVRGATPTLRAAWSDRLSSTPLRCAWRACVPPLDRGAGRRSSTFIEDVSCPDRLA